MKNILFASFLLLSAQLAKAQNDKSVNPGSGVPVKGAAITTEAERIEHYRSLTNLNFGIDSHVGGGMRNLIDTNAERATISGGFQNEVGSFTQNATVGGGLQNKIHRPSLSGTIGGGYDNQITNGISFGTIAGGFKNMIKGNGTSSAIGGGSQNVASGLWAIIPGGVRNAAEGNSSIAAGTMAKATHDGAIVISDAHQFPFKSSASNQFSLRATGGVRIVSAIEINGTNSINKAGIELAAGSGSWASLSDKAVKTRHESIDPKQILERVSALPITTWSYTTQDPSVRHIGPTAQDFRAAFPLGEDERHINTVDADGIALAAIQGLNTIVKEQEARLQEQAVLIQRLSQKLEALENKR